MDMAAISAGYYKFLPNREQITLNVPTGTSQALPWNAVTFNSYTVTDVVRRAPQVKEFMASGGAILSNDLVWLIPEAVMAALNTTDRPTPGGQIIDAASVEWTILEIMPRGLFGNTWRVVARNLAAVFGLTQLATIDRPNTTTDTSGKRNSAFTNVYANVRCRLQETGGAAEQLHDARTVTRQFNMITTTRLMVMAEDRVTIGGMLFTITGYQNPDGLANPMTVSLELVS